MRVVCGHAKRGECGHVAGIFPSCYARTPHPRAVTLPAASERGQRRALLYRIERSILDLLDLLQWRTLPLFRRKTLPLPAVSPPPNVTHDRFAEVKPSVTAGQTPLAPPPINQPNPSWYPVFVLGFLGVAPHWRSRALVPQRVGLRVACIQVLMTLGGWYTLCIPSQLTMRFWHSLSTLCNRHRLCPSQIYVFHGQCVAKGRESGKASRAQVERVCCPFRTVYNRT